MTDDEAAILRRRMADQIDDADRDSVSASREGPLVVTTVTMTTYPTAARRMYAVQITKPGGIEIEGQTVTIAAAVGGTFAAANLGSAIPPVGTVLIIDQVDGYWTFVYDG